MEFHPINKEDLTLMLMEGGLYDDSISIDDVLKRIGLSPNNLIISDQKTLDKFVDAYTNMKIEKQYEEKEEVSYFSDYKSKKSENFNGEKKKTETVIEIPYIDEIIKKEKTPEIQDLDDIFRNQENFQKNPHTIVDIKDDKKEESSYGDLFFDEDKKTEAKPAEKITILKDSNDDDILRGNPEKKEEISKCQEESQVFYSEKSSLLQEEEKKSIQGKEEKFSEKSSLLQEEEKKSMKGKEENSIEKSKEKVPSEQKSLLQTEEEKLSSLEEEALCLQHQWQYVAYCPDHAVLLCPLCLEDQRIDHQKFCKLTQAENVDKNSIVKEIFIDFKNIQTEAEKVIEKLLDLLRGLEEKQQKLSFEFIIESVNNTELSEKIKHSEENKQFILEVAQIVFEKYLISIIKIYNDRTAILEKAKTLNENADEDLKFWEGSTETQEKNIIFNRFLEKKREVLKINAEINAHRKLTDSVVTHPKKKMINAIVLTIFCHLTKLYSKMPNTN